MRQWLDCVVCLCVVIGIAVGWVSSSGFPMRWATGVAMGMGSGSRCLATPVGGTACALIVVRACSLVNDVAVKFGVSPSRMLDAIRADMVKGSGELRYGLAKFEGGIFVQVMRGASRSSHCGSEWGQCARMAVPMSILRLFRHRGDREQGFIAVLHLGHGHV